ncbi:hypothetical protein ACJJTC_014791 [Scirpophaga incertulas]
MRWLRFSTHSLDLSFIDMSLFIRKTRKRASFRLHILADYNDEDDEDEQEHQYAAYGDCEHRRVLAQLGGASRGARARRGERRHNRPSANDVRTHASTQPTSTLEHRFFDRL